MSFSPDTYLDKLYESNSSDFKFSFGDNEEYREWKEGLRKKLISILGGFPEKKVALKPQLIEEREYPNYHLQRVSFTTDKKMKVPAYVLKPKMDKDRFPAIIACHGHGYGSREVVGLDPEGNDNLDDPGCHNNFGLGLVEKGFLVIAPEYIGFGDRRLKEDQNKKPGDNSCYRIASFLLMLGKTLAGIRIYNTLRTVDYLYTRKDVKQEQIGCMGFSGGGLVSAFTGMLEERIKAVSVHSYTSSLQGSVMAMRHCLDNYLPGLLKEAPLAEFMGLIAPRPLLIESGTEDEIFPVEYVEIAYHRLKKVYDFLDKSDRLDKHIFKGGHEVRKDKVNDWFLKWLG